MNQIEKPLWQCVRKTTLQVCTDGVWTRRNVLVGVNASFKRGSSNITRKVPLELERNRRILVSCIYCSGKLCNVLSSVVFDVVSLIGFYFMRTPFASLEGVTNRKRSLKERVRIVVCQSCSLQNSKIAGNISYYTWKYFNCSQYVTTTSSKYGAINSARFCRRTTIGVENIRHQIYICGNHIQTRYTEILVCEVDIVC